MSFDGDSRSTYSTRSSRLTESQTSRSYSGSPPLPPPGAQDVEGDDDMNEIDDYESLPGNPLPDRRTEEMDRHSQNKEDVVGIAPVQARRSEAHNAQHADTSDEFAQRQKDSHSGDQGSEATDSMSGRQDWAVWEDLLEKTLDEVRADTQGGNGQPLPAALPLPGAQLPSAEPSLPEKTTPQLAGGLPSAPKLAASGLQPGNVPLSPLAPKVVHPIAPRAVQPPPHPSHSPRRPRKPRGQSSGREHAGAHVQLPEGGLETGRGRPASAELDAVGSRTGNHGSVQGVAAERPVLARTASGGLGLSLDHREAFRTKLWDMPWKELERVATRKQVPLFRPGRRREHVIEDLVHAEWASNDPLVRQQPASSDASAHRYHHHAQDPARSQTALAQNDFSDDYRRKESGDAVPDEEPSAAEERGGSARSSEVRDEASRRRGREGTRGANAAEVGGRGESMVNRHPSRTPSSRQPPDDSQPEQITRRGPATEYQPPSREFRPDDGGPRAARDAMGRESEGVDERGVNRSGVEESVAQTDETDLDEEDWSPVPPRTTTGPTTDRSRWSQVRTSRAPERAKDDLGAAGRRADRPLETLDVVRDQPRRKVADDVGWESEQDDVAIIRERLRQLAQGGDRGAVRPGDRLGQSATNSRSPRVDTSRTSSTVGRGGGRQDATRVELKGFDMDRSTSFQDLEELGRDLISTPTPPPAPEHAQRRSTRKPVQKSGLFHPDSLEFMGDNVHGVSMPTVRESAPPRQQESWQQQPDPSPKHARDPPAPHPQPPRPQSPTPPDDTDPFAAVQDAIEAMMLPPSLRVCGHRNAARRRTLQTKGYEMCSFLPESGVMLLSSSNKPTNETGRALVRMRLHGQGVRAARELWQLQHLMTCVQQEVEQMVGNAAGRFKVVGVLRGEEDEEAAWAGGPSIADEFGVDLEILPPRGASGHWHRSQESAQAMWFELEDRLDRGIGVGKMVTFDSRSYTYSILPPGRLSFEKTRNERTPRDDKARLLVLL